MDAIMRRVGQFLEVISWPPQTRSRIVGDTYNLVKEFPGLDPHWGMHEHGESMVRFTGTIPVVHRMRAYEVPLIIWLPRDYPVMAPLVFVDPPPTQYVPQGHPAVNANNNMCRSAVLDHWTDASRVVSVVSDLRQQFTQVGVPLQQRGPTWSPGSQSAAAAAAGAAASARAAAAAPPAAAAAAGPPWQLAAAAARPQEEDDWERQAKEALQRRLYLAVKEDLIEKDLHRQRLAAALFDRRRELEEERLQVDGLRGLAAAAAARLAEARAQRAAEAQWVERNKAKTEVDFASIFDQLFKGDPLAQQCWQLRAEVEARQAEEEELCRVLQEADRHGVAGDVIRRMQQSSRQLFHLVALLQRCEAELKKRPRLHGGAAGGAARAAAGAAAGAAGGAAAAAGSGAGLAAGEA
eukprot:TRINITY_DN19634_c0_g1_i1.p2 TRINITY_DN19634_c0_g1~~TRINITY_DN19634_c0_g1_i1.p2  ORF type:complete len:441 (+),score=130.01 TRINITY_DN19634_c0_g1_i1:100-1323(+)